MFKNLCISALGISGRPSEIIELALSNGFRGIDIDIADMAEQVKTHGLPHARRLLDSSRLKLTTFSLPVDWQVEEKDWPAELARLSEYTELAQQIGCTRATVTIQPSSETRPYHENFEFHRKRFASLAAALGERGMRLGVGMLAPTSLRAGHNFQFIQTVDVLVMLLSSVGAKNLGVLVDLFHWHLGGGTLEQLQSLPPEKIIKVIVSDVEPGATAEDATEAARHLPGETGVVDAAAVLKVLAEIKYDGPVTPKADKSRLAGLSRDVCARRAAASLDELWKAAGLHTPRLSAAHR